MVRRIACLAKKVACRTGDDGLDIFGEQIELTNPEYFRAYSDITRENPSFFHRSLGDYFREALTVDPGVKSAIW